mmetsp:Transcript_32666/g.50813  ORF Transcript_32666/g.50813 Transcript_32666/m.50813 type:complete len:202 (+) Transcript_32666:914-1519(+)
MTVNELERSESLLACNLHFVILRHQGVAWRICTLRAEPEIPQRSLQVAKLLFLLLVCNYILRRVRTLWSEAQPFHSALQLSGNLRIATCEDSAQLMARRITGSAMRYWTTSLVQLLGLYLFGLVLSVTSNLVSQESLGSIVVSLNCNETGMHITHRTRGVDLDTGFPNGQIGCNGKHAGCCDKPSAEKDHQASLYLRKVEH